MSDRYDPDPNLPYGTCDDCGQELPHEQDASDHMRQTLEDGVSSHRISVTNPGRERRIQRDVNRIVEDALDQAVSDLENLGLTDYEVAAALRWHDSFQQAWGDR